jgi:hypothetical protein
MKYSHRFMHRRNDRRHLALFAFAVAIAANCAEPGGLDRQAGLTTYDVTTTLDSFSFETSGPGCLSLYCFHFRAFAGAELTGTLTLPDSALRPDDPLATGTFGGTFCDSIDYVDLTGCLRVATIRVMAFEGYVSPRMPDDPTFSLFMVSRDSTPEITFSVLRAEGDSLVGRVSWTLRPWRFPPTHYGRFVARRRK